LIAQQGLPPIANTYLRARLSQSDVERFLSILDCIEATIKCSVIALLTTQWQAGTVNNSAAIASQLNVPSLGHWIDILCTVITHQPQTSFQKQIADFWYAPLVQTAREVIEDANQSGFSWRGDIPQNHLQWLRWFSWLRNVTRGHGVVKEESIGNLWRSLQKT